jgi:drug/metabolite transporter (DMT)-like permease
MMGEEFSHTMQAAPKEASVGLPTAVSTQIATGSAILCWLLAAGVYIAAKVVTAEMPPWALCFWRVFIAGLILLPIIRRDWPAMISLVRQRWFSLLIIGGLGFSLSPALIYIGLSYTSAINAGLLIALMPVITMILARFVLNEPVGTWQFFGSIVAFVGMAVIVTRGDLRALIRLDLNTGEILVICAAVAFALYTVLLRRAKYPLPGLPLLVLLLGAAVVVAIPFYVWELLHDERTVLNTKGLWALAYVAGPGGALMYYLFNLSVQALGASRAGVFLYLQTVFIAVLAYCFLGERLLSYHFVGAFFIMVGVLLVMFLKGGCARS